ncbi:MAG TPA: SGNH/GDSL hydrolase family protein [Lacibacter sp.]|nr:SGNH/GDSL hydrolase family protein [Lacibacter sp.]HMO89246.1 SGNH/GDSL hydrolase family protein [Lacibacter sp.]HMP86643.1 SGNH/GDSL hydrolase family protein [Lacibacter sp.]
MKKTKLLLLNLLFFAFLWGVLELLSWFIYKRLPDTHNGKMIVQSELGLPFNNSIRSILPHPYLLYVNNPQYVDSIRQHNEWGYRNDPFPFKKDSGTLRVLLLGGSTTYGYLNKNPKTTWGHLLEQKLQQLTPQKVQVINGGLNYGTSAEMLAGYMFRHRYLQPDWVIYHGGGNDASATVFPNYDPEYTHLRASGNKTNLRRFERRILRVSRFFRLLYAFWLSDMATVYQSQPGSFNSISYEEVKERIKNPAHYTGFERNIDLLTQTALHDGARVALVGYLHASIHKVEETRPDLAGIADLVIEAISRNKELMRQVARKHNVPYINVDSSTFRDELFLDNCHLNPEGEALKAAIIFEQLKPYFGGK